MYIHKNLPFILLSANEIVKKLNKLVYTNQKQAKNILKVKIHSRISIIIRFLYVIRLQIVVF